jgi:hypothetical protein
VSQNKILIDTNTYFRLAQSIHPLLKSNFGNPPSQLYITKDLEGEFKSNPRLQGKFGWFWQDDYVKNRNAPLQLSKTQKKQFDNDRLTFIGIANDMGLTNISLEDIHAATYASILGISLVTDDGDLTTLCTDLGVNVICTLDLLKVMLDCSHIKIEQVRAIAGYWFHMADCPKNFKSDYKRIFNEDVPVVLSALDRHSWWDSLSQKSVRISV